MRWKLLISVLGVFLVSVFLIGRPLLAQDNQLYEEISILQVTHFTLESATDVNIIVYAPNSNEVTLFYSNINKYESQAMKKIDNHYWEGIIPQEELMAGYVEYFVEVDSPEGSKRSDIQSIEVNPHLRINSENEVLALGDYFYDIQFYKGKLPSGYTIPSSISSSVRPNL